MRALVLLALLGACDVASSDPGLDSVLEIANAQYRPGAFPTDEGGRAAALSLATRHPTIVIDRVVEKTLGLLDPAARTAVFGIDGYDGAWIVPAGPPDFSAPGFPTANITFGVRGTIEPGPFTLRLAAADADGRFGAPATAMVVADAAPEPTGELVITLEWQGHADLDLHVVDGDGGEVWSDKPNSMNPPAQGVPVDPTEYQKHGILDHDGNKNCRFDGGTPNEHVIWTMPPPPGDYIVRVDARAMCGAPAAAWHVSAKRNDDLLGAVRGVATPGDVVPDPSEPQPLSRAGQGVLALRFSL